MNLPASVCATIFLLLSLLLPTILFANAQTGNPLNLTPEEQVWLDAHQVIRLAPDPDFPPLEYLDKGGVYRGIAADYIALLEKKLPLKFEIVKLDSWSEVLRQIQAKEIDMLGAAVPTPERLKYLKFTRSYVEFPAVVLVRDSVSKFPKLRDLTGKRVAVVANYADHEYMEKAYPEIPLEVMPDISSGLRQVSFGKVDAMILNLASASFYIRKDGISNLKVSEDTDFVFDLSFAARDDWPILINVLEKGLAAITPQEKKAILDSWISLGRDQWRPTPVFWASLTAGMLLLITLMVLSWNRSLQRQVQTRTLQLRKELEDRVRAEQEKEQLLKQIHQAKKMEVIGQLAGGVAHDLNNILAGVIGSSEMLLRKIPQEDRLSRHAQMVRDAGKRAAAVVADLLTISRNAASDKRPADLNTLLTEFLNSPESRVIQERFPEVEVVTCLAPNLLNIKCSSIHIKKAVMNLLLNASEATIKGRVTISTENCYVDRPFGSFDKVRIGEYVLLTLADDGPGISQSDLEHIFDPFYSKKKMGHSGTGLGLTVVWNSLQDHEGYIDIKQPGSGTVFELYFPVCREAVIPAAGEESVESFKGNGEHILVVDDEEHIRDLAAQMLAELNYKVSLAASGEAAVELLRRQNVDLLLLDMIMDPGINGCQAYEQICLLNPGQKAVISSGFSQSSEVERAQGLGAGRFLKKPYTFCELGQAVKAELESCG